ncbi:MAG: hypothetical protein AAB383_00030 [Patescibacteria group bacterium]
MKKLSSFTYALACLLAGSLFLTACGGSDTSEVDGETEETGEVFYFAYKTADFEIEVPDTWEIIDSFTSEYPDDLRVAFKNNVQDSIFTSNVTVIRENNTLSDTSYDFAQRKLADHEDTLVNYSLVSQEVLTLQVDGANSKTMLSTFEGKNDTSSPKLTFMQVTLTKGQQAWTATATYRSGEDAFTVEELDTMLRSFTLN